MVRLKRKFFSKHISNQMICVGRKYEGNVAADAAGCATDTPYQPGPPLTTTLPLHPYRALCEDTSETTFNHSAQLRNNML